MHTCLGLRLVGFKPSRGQEGCAPLWGPRGDAPSRVQGAAPQVMEQYNELLRILGQFTKHNLMMDEAIYVLSAIDKLPPSWKDFKHTLKHQKEELPLVQLGSHLHIEESLRAEENDKPKGKDVVGSSSVNMVEDRRATKTNDKKGKKKVYDNKHDGSNKKTKLTCWKCGKSGHFKRDCHVGKGGHHFKNTNGASGSEAFYVQDNDVAWWIDSGATTHASKDRGWFKVFQPLDGGSFLHTGNESSAPIVGVGSVVLEFTYGKTISLSNVLYVSKLHKNLVSGPVLNKCGFRQVFESDNYILSKSGVFVGFGYYNNGQFEPKKKSLGERGIECIFIGYGKHSKAYRPKEMISSTNGTHKETESSEMTPDEPMELRKSKRKRKSKSFGPDFQLYLIEGSRYEVSTLYPYCFNVKDDPKTFDEAMKSQDVVFWKEAINDEMDSIIGNNAWVLADLPPGCKPLGCKWIFKKKMKVDGTIEKFKARLVIQGFRQRPGIDYSDIYAPVARISTIRLLIALESIHNLVIHQMYVKTAFLNGDLDEEVYMKQPEGFIMPSNKHKVCKLVKSLYGLKQAPKQWHKKFDEVVLSSGYHLNQSDKCVYNKFDNSRNGVIICLYVDDMLIFGTNQQQVDLTKEFLSSRFSMKDMGEADVILDPSVKLMPNTEKVVFKLEYSKVIGYFMYAMTSRRLDIAYAVGKLSRYSDASWITNVEDYSSTSGWVFLLGGGAIS
ncbi:UNVERIFIED_CONTAM: Retrovirus-related Pol polyprotein from transposon TNT 1-94 [Sesamum calycinum]|uniref:Retrovirus-related Pol polyprotein from transposon TNT 1-94 n=1 Tax=Sesamum calycinum TaxID=2727403 RepID=A0AAW2M9L2_9LAMI